ncbi:MAG: polysaccharide deacetylase family protein [Rhodoblastus sp.]
MRGKTMRDKTMRGAPKIALRLASAILVWALAARPAQAEPGPACKNPDALGVSRTIGIGAAGGLHIGQKTYPQTLALADKEIVLTFDDGPLPGLTDKALDALAAECVRAVFFFIGRNAQANPQLVQRAQREGHTIGSHSWSHPARTLRGISEAAAIEEIRRGAEAVQRASSLLPQDASRPATAFFRFPGFADTPQTLAFLDAQGAAVFGADLWASDWLVQKPAAELELTMKRLNASRGGILLLHDIRAQTIAMLPALLRRLKREGFRIVQVKPGSGRPALKGAPPGWKSQTDGLVPYRARQTGAVPGSPEPQASGG